jgi:hypothetical protein
MLASVSRGEFVRLFHGAVSTPIRASAVAPALEGLLDVSVGRVSDEELAQRSGVFATTRRWYGLCGRAGPVEEVEEVVEVEVEEVDEPYVVTGASGPSEGCTEGDEEDFFGLGAAEVGEGDWDCLFSDSDEEA